MEHALPRQQIGQLGTQPCAVPRLCAQYIQPAHDLGGGPVKVQGSVPRLGSEYIKQGAPQSSKAMTQGGGGEQPGSRVQCLASVAQIMSSQPATWGEQPGSGV